MDCVEVYIDDIAAFSNDLPSHMIAVSKILSILNRHNFLLKQSSANGRIKLSLGLDIWSI